MNIWKKSVLGREKNIEETEAEVCWGVPLCLEQTQREK